MGDHEVGIRPKMVKMVKVVTYPPLTILTILAVSDLTRTAR